MRPGFVATLARRGELRQAAPQSIKMSSYKVIGGNQREYGPVSADEVRQWIGDGRLNAQSLTRAETSPEWKPLSDFPEFADALRQPKAPPQISAVPVTPTDWTSQILAREPDLRVGECLSSGVSFFTANAGFVIGTVLITWFLNLAMSLVPIMGGVLLLLFSGVITGGLYLACLRRMRGETVGIGSIFDGFKLCFVQLMLVGTLSSVLTSLSILLCALPWVYFKVAWILALPLVADKRVEFWSAMELSRKVITRVWFKMFLLLALVFLPFIAVQILTGVKLGAYLYGTLRAADFDILRWIQDLQPQVGQLKQLSLTWVTWAAITQVTLLVCQFFAVGALMRAYENLFGTRKS